jgi:hypothetical protein
MRHDWILEVLNDLRDYARKNELPLIAAKTDELLSLAREELARLNAPGDEPTG